MTARFALVLLIFCGFSVTDAWARSRTLADRVTAVEPGLITLETHGPATLAGVWLSPDATLELKPGAAVEIKALPKDRYNRTPVWLYAPGSNATLQEALVGQGQAMLYDRAASPAAWRKAEASAKATRLGLWASAPLTPEKVGEHVGKVVRVQGRVTRTYKSRSMHYINFGEDWKTDFSLRIPRKAWRAFGKEFAVTDGACVQARGSVFLDNGPMIELTRPEQMEILPCVGLSKA